jgi:hypothetical protein
MQQVSDRFAIKRDSELAVDSSQADAQMLFEF